MCALTSGESASLCPPVPTLKTTARPDKPRNDETTNNNQQSEIQRAATMELNDKSQFLIPAILCITCDTWEHGSGGRCAYTTISWQACIATKWPSAEDILHKHTRRAKPRKAPEGHSLWKDLKREMLWKILIWDRVLGEKQGQSRFPCPTLCFFF